MLTIVDENGVAAGQISLTLWRDLHILGLLSMIAPSSNGKTADSGSVYRGSNPCGAATTKLGLKVKPNFVVGLIV